ncbi:MAG: PHP domain-containing protein [Clostridia bacterium]|nr:PHP domain-containing protein [Clostridia bacterium]
MLIDMHAHTSGISTCCRADATAVVAAAKKVGLDGLIVTNHYAEAYAKKRPSPRAFAEDFTEEYHRTREIAEREGLKAFFGIEVTMKPHDNVHMLVYGVSEAFLLEHPELYLLTQEELYALVHENGGYLVQAHPMRKGKNVLLDLSYLDGIEINSHPLYDKTYFEEISEIAHAHGKFLTSGGDYHADTHRPRCGAYLPETLTSTREIIEYLKDLPRMSLCIQEPDATVCRRVAFERK